MTQHLNFSKYHGLGNDFIVIDGISQRIDMDKLRTLTPQFCERHRGVGADGIVVLLESEECDFKMVIFNQDGSEPEMCGNGVRCLTQFIYDKNLINSLVFSLETKAGTMLPAIIKKDGLFSAVEVDMGEPQNDITIMEKGTICYDKKITIDSKSYDISCISLGNPHAVMFVENIDFVDASLGAKIESLFVNGINVEFVEIIDEHRAKVKVWERGVGYTLACGTGACAVVVAGVTKNKLKRKSVIELPGGHLAIEWYKDTNKILMTGPSVQVFEGHLIF
ncbi:MAG: diaminopimelate epimerase [Rickettsiales bacterium]|nr:diaminopimelate epimerase [Rickettsiales bacterium]|tara:strand:+ start:1633 stop:2466 length:834 start_codon:yes stop_codon:yes gene_type:complete